MIERDTLVVDPLALPNSLDRLYYIVGPSEDRSLTGSSYWNILRGFLLASYYTSDFLVEDSITLLYILLFFAITFQALVQYL